MSGLSKSNGTKIKVQPDATSVTPALARALGYTDLAIAFGGAGDGPFIDKLVQCGINTAKAETSLDDACERIDAGIKGFYEEHGHIFQTGHCPQVELI